MSRHVQPVDLVVEWSPRGVRAHDGRARSSFDGLNGLSGREAVIAVSRRSVFVRATRVPDAPYDEVRRVLAVRLGDLFPMPSQELAFDFQLTDDLSEGGRLALVAAMPAHELRRLHTEMKQAGLRVRQVVPAAMGSALLAQTLGKPNAAVVQRAEEGITIDLVAEGALRYSRVAGSVIDLTAEVCRTFTIANMECADIIAAGDVAVPHADLHSATTSMDAMVNAGDRLGLNIELPETIATRILNTRKQRLRFAGLLAASAAMLALYAFSEYEAAAAKVQTEQSKAAGRLRKLKSLQKQAEADALKSAKLQATLEVAFKPAQSFGDLVTVVSNRTPAGVWLTGVNIERGKPLTVRGTARTSGAVAEYLRLLGSEPRVRDVKLVFANNSTIEKVPVVQFSISAFPVGNLPLAEQNDRRRS